MEITDKSKAKAVAMSHELLEEPDREREVAEVDDDKSRGSQLQLAE